MKPTERDRPAEADRAKFQEIPGERPEANFVCTEFSLSRNPSVILLSKMSFLLPRFPPGWEKGIEERPCYRLPDCSVLHT